MLVVYNGNYARLTIDQAEAIELARFSIRTTAIPINEFQANILRLRFNIDLTTQLEEPEPMTIYATNEFSVIINWNEDVKVYDITFPVNMLPFVRKYTFLLSSNDLTTIYETASTLAKSYRNETGDSRYKVWPKKGTTAFLKLNAKTCIDVNQIVPEPPNDYTFHLTYKNGYIHINMPVKQCILGYQPAKYNNIEDALFEAKQYVIQYNGASNRNFYNLWPKETSPEFNKLKQELKAFYENPILDKPNDCSFIVQYDAVESLFYIKAPSRKVTNYVTERHTRKDLLDVYNTALTLFRESKLNNPDHKINVWPHTSSSQFAELLDMNNGLYPEVMDKDENSIVVHWDSSVCKYFYVLPQAITSNRRVDTCSEGFNRIHDVYIRAFRAQRQIKIDLNIVLNIWPKRGSFEYFSLCSNTYSSSVKLNEGRVFFIDTEKNPTGVTSVSLALADILAFKNDYSYAEHLVNELLKYTIWTKYRYDFSAREYNDLKLRLMKLLNKGNDQWQLLDNTIYIYNKNILISIFDDYFSTEPSYVHKALFDSVGNTCGMCNRNYRKDYTHELNNQVLCSHCLDEAGFYRCTYCRPGVYHNQSDTCPSVREMPVDNVWSYNTDVCKIIPKMYHTVKDKTINGAYLRYGVELEIIQKRTSSDSDRIVFRTAIGEAIKGHAIMKSDSSIGSNGVEIVTVPATLDFHRETMWNKLFVEGGKFNVTPASLARSWSTGLCGLHVHITRAALTKIQLSKLLVFYHETQNNHFLSKIAGREVGPDAQYCKAYKKRKQFNTDEYRDHHDAITISSRNRGKTAEVRIFKGNITKHGILRAIEFVDATVKWAATASVNKLGYPYFIAWFNRPEIRQNYPDLWRHLIDLKYLKTEHKSFVEVGKTKSGKSIRKSKSSLDVIPLENKVA